MTHATDPIEPKKPSAPRARELVAAKKAAAAKAPATPPETSVAPPDNRKPYERILDEMAPSWTEGRVIKFSHDDGTFRTRDDEKEVSPTITFGALCSETLFGWVKFNGPNEQPDRHMGRLYDDSFALLPRASLGDLEKARWEINPWGLPEDPWQLHEYVVLQRTDTSEIFTFTATNSTGRFAASRLLKHYNRTCKGADEVPLVQLRTGKHKQRPVPVFVVVGSRPLSAVAKPDGSNTESFVDDEIPFK